MKKYLVIIITFIAILSILFTSCKVNQFYTLTITQPENGTIEVDPEANSDGEYAEGTVVTLTATPDEGYEFLNWINDASGTENPTQILMNYDKEVSGVFGDATPPADVTNLEASSGYKEVVLTWTDPEDSDLDIIQITHDQTGGGAGKTVSAGTETYTWTGLENGTTYTFTVKAIDQSDNESSGVTVDSTPIGTLESFGITVNTTGDIKQGIPFSVTITALDQGGEPFTVDQDTNLNLTVNPSNIQITPTTEIIPASQSSVTFNITPIDAGNITIIVSNDTGTVTGTSSPIEIISQPYLKRFEVLAPASARPATDFSLTIRALDQFNNFISVGDTAITVDLQSLLTGTDTQGPSITPNTATISADNYETTLNVQIASEDIVDIKATTTIDMRDVKGTSYPIDVTNTMKLAYYIVTTSITGTTINILEAYDVTVVAKDQDGNNFLVTEDKNITLSPSDNDEQITIRTGTMNAGTDSVIITTSFENPSNGTRLVAKDQNHTRGETTDVYTVNNNTSLVFEETFETGFTPNVWSDWYITVNNNTYKPGTTIDNAEGHNSSKSLKFENTDEESEIKVIDIDAGAGGALLKFYYKYDKKGDDTDPRARFKLYDTVHSGVGLGYATTGGQEFNETNGDWVEKTILLPPGEREIGWLFFSGIDTNNVAYIDDIRVYGNADVSIINIHPEIIVTDEAGGEGIEISSGGTIDLGSWGVGSGSHTFEFSILNEHKGNLNITDQGSDEYVDIDRTELSFSTGTNGFNDSISPFNYTDFELILSTGTNTGGQVTAVASIISNDPDESPYNINITYDVTTPIPDISVSYNENTINDNDSFSLGTAFIGYTNTFPITINNNGSDTLTLTDQGSGDYVTVTGTEYSVANQPSPNINQNSTTTFDIEVDLSTVTAGTYTTTVTIQTNVSAPKDVYTFDLSVDAIDGLADINDSFENDFFDYPWILGYEDNDNPSFADQYDNTSEAPHIEDGDVIDGDSEIISPSDGTKMVQFGQVEINGNDSTETAPIGGKDKSYIEIIFDTTEDKTLHFDWMVDGDDMNVYLDGTKEISITSTNSDGWIHDKILITTGSSHVVRWEYEKDIYNSYYSDTGWLDNVYTETAKSEIEVTTPLTVDPLQDGISVVDLGSFGTGNPETFEFTIKNTDLLDLELTGSPLIVLPSGTQLSVDTPPTTPIPYESTTTFILQINPTTLVTDQQETISIPNNSPDGDFTFDVVYDVVNPVAEINVKDPDGNDLLDGSGIFSAKVEKDSATPYEYTFTIENSGTGELVLNEHNSGSGDYVELTTSGPISVTTQPTTPIDAYSGTTTFTITVTPDGSLTTYTGTVEILSNDADESPYTFDININSAIKNLVDSFENYDDNQQIKDFTVSSPWGTPWNGGVSSDYQGSDPSLPKEPYVNEVTYPTTYKYLTLLGYGVLGNDTGPNGESGLSGRWNTGYTYAQLSFTPTTDGEIEFYIRIAKDYNPTVPIGEDTVSFWMDIDSSDIGLPGEPTPDWTYTLGPDEGIAEIIVTFPVTSGTVYNLTWKAQKDTAGHRENMIRLDEIYYWELP